MLVSAFLQGPLHVLYPAWRDRRGRMEFELDNGVFPISWTTWISERWCPSLGGHCPLWNKTAFPCDQAVSITALSGRLKSESLLGLWKRRKKYTNEKIHVRIRHPPPFLTNKKNVLQLLSFKKKINKKLFTYTYETREIYSMGIPKTNISRHCCLSQSLWSFSLPVYVTYCTHSLGQGKTLWTPLAVSTTRDCMDVFSHIHWPLNVSATGISLCLVVLARAFFSFLYYTDLGIMSSLTW